MGYDYRQQAQRCERGLERNSASPTTERLGRDTEVRNRFLTHLCVSVLIIELRTLDTIAKSTERRSKESWLKQLIHRKRNEEEIDELRRDMERAFKVFDVRFLVKLPSRHN
jgi:sugar diacid utilization regulator